MKKVIVIGAGPAGMMAAITAAKNNNKVILLDGNEKVGKKLFITGKGRCNVTNSKDISEFFDFIPEILIFYIVHYILIQMKIQLIFLNLKE